MSQLGAHPQVSSKIIWNHQPGYVVHVQNGWPPLLTRFAIHLRTANPFPGKSAALPKDRKIGITRVAVLLYTKELLALHRKKYNFQMVGGNPFCAQKQIPEIFGVILHLCFSTCGHTRTFICTHGCIGTCAWKYTCSCVRAHSCTCSSDCSWLSSWFHYCSGCSCCSCCNPLRMFVFLFCWFATFKTAVPLLPLAVSPACSCL